VNQGGILISGAGLRALTRLNHVVKSGLTLRSPVPAADVLLGNLSAIKDVLADLKQSAVERTRTVCGPCGNREDGRRLYGISVSARPTYGGQICACPSRPYLPGPFDASSLIDRVDVGRFH